MDIIGIFAAALAGLIGALWRARPQPDVWPKTLTVRGARVTISAGGMMVYRRADGSFWAERLALADRHYRSAAQAEPADPRRELH